MKIYIALCFALVVHFAQAQTTQLTIADEAGNSITGATLKVLNHVSPWLSSNQNGEIEIPAAWRNKRAAVKAPGFAAVELVLSDTLSVVRLERAAVQLDDAVVITASRFERSKFNITEAASVLSEQDLSITNPRSTPEALMGSAGVWVQKTNHGGGSPIIRGLVGNQVLLMVDGIRLNNTTYRYGPNQYLATVDPGLIERAEVIRGAGSVMYGSDALGGVVQLFSKTPQFRNGGSGLTGSVTGKWMSAGMEKSGRLELDWGSERMAVHGGLSVRSFGDIVAGGSLGTLDPTGYEEVAADFKTLTRTGTDGVLTAAFQHHEQRHVPRYDQVQQGGFELWEFNPQVRQLGYLRWERATRNPLLSSLRITTSVNRSLEEVQSRRNNSLDLMRFRDEINTYGVIAEGFSSFNEHWQAQSGVEWYYDRVDSRASVLNESSGIVTPVRGSYADGATASNFAAFTSHAYEAGPWALTAGARFNAITLRVSDERFGDVRIRPEALVMNAGLSYQIASQYRLFANVNSGFRAPNIDDISRFGPVESTVFEVPSANLSPEKSRTAEVGIKMRSRKINVSLSAYYTRLIDLIDRVPVSFEGQDSLENRRVYQKQNVSKSEVRGFEAEGEWSISNQLSLYANITYTYGENLSRNEPMRRIPPVFGRVSLLYRHSAGFWSRLDYLSAGDQDRLAAGDRSDSRIAVRLRDDAMPGWSVFNLYVGYTYRRISLIASGQNLFDEAYRVYASGVDGYGRSLLLTAKFQF